MKFELGAFHSEVIVYSTPFRYSRKLPLDVAGNLDKTQEPSKMPYRGRFSLGYTDWTNEEIYDLLLIKNNLKLFHYKNHELLLNNCNDMSLWVSDILDLADTFPLWIDRLPKLVGRYFQPIYGTIIFMENVAKGLSPLKYGIEWLNGDIVPNQFHLKYPLELKSKSVSDHRQRYFGTNNIKHEHKEDKESIWIFPPRSDEKSYFQKDLESAP